MKIKQKKELLDLDTVNNATNDSQSVNKKIAERLAYFNKLYSKEKGEPEDTEED